MTEDKEKLKGSFGDKGTNVNQIAYGHPYADKMISEAVEVIRESKTGSLLLRLLENKLVPVHVIKGTGESGYSPELNTIYIQTPGKAESASALFIVHLIKSLHEAAQELSGHKTPDPTKDILAYASFIHGRNLDSITEVCKVVNELTNSSYFSDLLDTLDQIGLNNVYKAYLNNASREEIYEKYAEAYDASNRGSY